MMKSILTALTFLISLSASAGMPNYICCKDADGAAFELWQRGLRDTVVRVTSPLMTKSWGEEFSLLYSDITDPRLAEWAKSVGPLVDYDPAKNLVMSTMAVKKYDAVFYGWFAIASGKVSCVVGSPADSSLELKFEVGSCTEVKSPAGCF